MMIVRGSLAVVAVLAAACGSSSSSSNEGTTDAGTHVHESSGSSSGSVNGGNYILEASVQHHPEECAGKGGACHACCEEDFLPGAQFYRLGIEACACAGKGTCSDVCDARECSELRGRDMTCQTCLTKMTADPCEAKAKDTCGGDSACKTYLTCIGGC